jgi:hypothetical protein
VGALASEQIADLDKRHFLAWRPRRLCLLVLLQAGLDDEEQHPCHDDEIDRNSEKLPHPHARERCRTEGPVLEEDGSANAHRTACHFWREIEIPEALPPASQLRSDPNLAKLQEFFRRTL